jgi:NitT/TauT family transport system permease protein
MGATEKQMFRRIYLPGALPAIGNGLRVGCILCFLAILGAETIAGFSGLGTAIARSSEALNTTEMFAYIIFVIVLAGFLNAALSAAQKRLSPGETAQ